MKFETCKKESFAVIGKEGSTKDGADFIPKLWEIANAKFNEVAPVAKKDAKGNLLGVWGVMSDFSRSFKPWENNFTEGLYLAGVETVDGAEAPEGWTKWVIPAYEYIYTEYEGEATFGEALAYMEKNGLSLAGAVHDFTCPETGKNFMFFPVKQL